MKTKIVKNRRQKRSEKSLNGQSSKYAKKIQRQKRGIFNIESPFRLTESNQGIDLSVFNKLRFRN